MLEVKNLRLTLNGHPVLRGINLVVKKGEIHTILGVNGAGKSSLAYCLMGSEGYRPQEGIIKFLGKDITNLSITERARMGLTLAWQESARFEGLSAREYLSLGIYPVRNNPTPKGTDASPLVRISNGVGNREDSKRIAHALELVALNPKEFLDRAVDNTLSGGERKRIELASVIAMRPKLAILDEPDSGIDMLSLDDILNVIKSMRKEGSTILLITHREEMASISDRASLMCDGLILKTGKPKEEMDYFKLHCKPCPTHKFPGKLKE
ncbi:ABC transporter ATP-binding protein [bacterium]|nr:ABC transporter ATP-binding protein [bacterium]MBU4561117.1 ABC transporter ATP-binding protein [bacterium]MCG2676433.1 ABC transporter ATP-binding protein [bacterium]MCG2678318.1 ABC transporter ATP-binding protein [bacterium]